MYAKPINDCKKLPLKENDKNLLRHRSWLMEIEWVQGQEDSMYKKKDLR